MLIAAGLPITYTSKQLGHSTIAVTCDIYTHTLHETSSSAMARLDARFNGGAQVVPIRTGTKG